MGRHAGLLLLVGSRVRFLLLVLVVAGAVGAVVRARGLRRGERAGVLGLHGMLLLRLLLELRLRLRVLR